MANRPLVSYQLALLERSGFKEALVATTSTAKEKMDFFLSQVQYPTRWLGGDGFLRADTGTFSPSQRGNCRDSMSPLAHEDAGHYRGNGELTGAVLRAGIQGKRAG